MKTKLEFFVGGSVQQSVEILDPEITPRHLIAGLNAGEYLTTIQEGGEVCMNEPNGRIIARVLSVENECFYDNFKEIK